MFLVRHVPLRGVVGILRLAPRVAPTTGVCYRHFSDGKPPKSAALERRKPRNVETPKPAEDSKKPVRYGPTDVDLKPRDQLRPLLPTWNSPPTRVPKADELKEGFRVRFNFEGRWWPATIREEGDDGVEVKVGYDGWPSRHDEWVPRTSDRLFLHESHHEDYVAPPMPPRYQKPVLKDSEGNPLPPTPRPPRPKIYDPEKERLKRALRPPMPYNPEKERLKRLLRGQHAPAAAEEAPRAAPARSPAAAEEAPKAAPSRPLAAAEEAPKATPARPADSETSSTPPSQPDVGKPEVPQPVVLWLEVLGGLDGSRAFKHAVTGIVHKGAPTSGWAQVLAPNGQHYYWNVDKGETTWEAPSR
mmetsp:Transcript_12459/g.34312  ORF Transcript_12459/g.34312 Transcript_12459/m.34312 type:complete len:358 (-) Transcript_12459:92-1165(-)